MRLAQISDLHFGSVALSPFQFFSKRWLGNFNYFLNRKKEFLHDRLSELIDFFKEHGITHVLITGDLSVTSRKKEFKLANRFIKLLQKEGFIVFSIPGNHDHYTKRSHRKRHFYRFFEHKYDATCPFSLQEHGVTYTQLQEGLWLVAIDTAVATSWRSSQGHFLPKVEEALEKVFQEIPKKDKIIVINHFPFFENDVVKKQLVRGTFLKQQLQKQNNVILYLHGHSHRQTVADLRGNDLPIISDCGSTPHRKNGACHLFHFGDNTLKLMVYRYDAGWKKSEDHSFQL